MSSSEVQRCLEQADVNGIKRFWAEIAPHLPQPKTDEETLAGIHHARTIASSISDKLRFYSHRWLLDRGYPSGLPDNLKPSAERLYPQIAMSVGISVNSKGLFKEAVPFIRKAMEDVVIDCYANGDTDPVIVKPRMMEARATTVRKLFGTKI